MRDLAFTICTRNYIGLAKILEKSIKRHYIDSDFLIFVADTLEGVDEREGLVDISGLELYEAALFQSMAYKYTLTEFCTAVKPAVIEYAFNILKYDKVLYFDPDILVFNSLQCVFEELDYYDALLTPHILTFPMSRESKGIENGLLKSGIFNLGFLGVKNTETVQKMLIWWKDNLVDKCFVSKENAEFTDQKWMDFLPLYFRNGGLRIVDSYGWNLAPWNFHEREVIDEQGTLYVKNRVVDCGEDMDLLIFVHYSGYDYRKLINYEIIQRNLEGQQIEGDIVNIINIYSDAIRNNADLINRYISIPYKYAFFADGKPIAYEHRRLYNGLLINGYMKLEDNPFDTDVELYVYLKSNKMMIERRNSGIETDKENSEFVRNKLKKINILFRMMRKVLGFEKYTVFIRFIKRYATWENQVFHLDKDYHSWV